MTDKNKLVLGCGTNNLGNEWLHLDISNLDHVDVVHDLEKGSLPFESNSFNEVRAVHVLEHLTQDALISILKEVNRVAETGADIFIVLPHFLSWNAADLDHYRAGSCKTFIQFCQSYDMNSPFTTIFREQSIDYVFLNRFLVNFSRLVLGDKRTAQYIPNAVNEIQYRFKNLNLY